MRHLVLLTAALSLSACATPGAPPPSDPGASLDATVARLDARIVGLTEELNRLGRRVRAIEDSLLADAPAVEEPIADPEPTAGAESSDGLEPPSPEPASPEAPAARMSGIVLDLRDAETFPAGRSWPRWRVVDPDGADVISSDGVDEQVLRIRPFFFTAPTGADFSLDLEPLLGSRRVEVGVREAAVVDDGEKAMTALVVIDAAAAADLRARPELAETLAAGNVVFLVRPAE